MKRICVVGTWHQAAVVSACLADMGHHVRGVGDDPGDVDALNAAEPPVYEPGLGAILRRNLKAGRLEYGTDYAYALKGAEYAYISIDTPVGPNDESDLSDVYDAACKVSHAMSDDLILCMTAQVPVGTCDQISELIAAENKRHRCHVAYVPEFLRLGTAVENFRHPDRVVVGTKDRRVGAKIAELYKPLKRPIVMTDIRSAEMAKHASNAFLASSISFINEIADLSEEVGADAPEVARIMKLDRRIGPLAFLGPGLGFAGGTLGREIRALQKLGASHGVKTTLLDATWLVNERRPALVTRKLEEALEGLQGRQIGVLGLTYKAGTSTCRRAVSFDIVRELARQGARIKAFDALASLMAVRRLPEMKVCADPYQVAEGSNALVLITEWRGIEALDLHRLRQNMLGDVFLDTRNIFEPERMAKAGFRYFGIGR